MTNSRKLSIDHSTLFHLQGSDFSEINYFIFVILSECDLYIDLSPSTKTYRILFKPKPLAKDNYGKTCHSKIIRHQTWLLLLLYYDWLLYLYFSSEYLSINKGQTVKAVALDSRSDFVAWLSAIRLAKFGTDLSLAYHRNLTIRQYLEKQQSTKQPFKALNVTKTASNIDFQKVKGKFRPFLNKSIKTRLKWKTKLKSLKSHKLQRSQNSLKSQKITKLAKKITKLSQRDFQTPCFLDNITVLRHLQVLVFDPSSIKWWNSRFVFEHSRTFLFSKIIRFSSQSIKYTWRIKTSNMKKELNRKS